MSSRGRSLPGDHPERELGARVMHLCAGDGSRRGGPAGARVKYRCAGRRVAAHHDCVHARACHASVPQLGAATRHCIVCGNAEACSHMMRL